MEGASYILLTRIKNYDSFFQDLERCPSDLEHLLLLQRVQVQILAPMRGSLYLWIQESQCLLLVPMTLADTYTLE